MRLTDSVQYMKGVGPKTAELLARLGIETIQDLVCYFPFRYDDFAKRQIDSLIDGEKATLSGLVVTPPQVAYYGKKRNRLTFKIKQEEAVIGVSFFNQAYLQSKIVPGDPIAIYGKWEARSQTIIGMKVVATQDGFQPVYHTIQGVKQSLLINLIRLAIDSGVLTQLSENLPQDLLTKYRLLGRIEAVKAMHFPDDQANYQQALRRMKFEELLLFQLKLQLLKKKTKTVSNGVTLTYDQQKMTQKIETLPFSLTDAQRTVLAEILGDMAQPIHMNRLLQGDVGSGKTVIASLAMYAAVTSGYQAAMMAPTEILAQQHYDSLRALYPEMRIGILTSGLKAKARKATLVGLETGELDMVVGTHALIQKGVNYYRLGLVITDEQHRFGVNQRQVFREKGDSPDVLMMTATPIPRTLAITAFGDMDVSIIDQLPAGRKPITTRWVKHEQFDQVLEWTKKQVASGAQVYVLSPLIDESESMDLKNATALHAELSDYFGETVKVALLHGQMKNDDKEAIMSAFKANQIAVLVSTTVIEVGVNVPNASIMIIMDADRFGLSQLHQLRGRVGRGEKKSYAILVANPKTEVGKARMKIMCETQNGFVLAEEDLKMRGSGEIFGTKQSGLPQFAVADLVNDYSILEVARQEAKAIVANEADYQALISSINVTPLMD